MITKLPIPPSWPKLSPLLAPLLLKWYPNNHRNLPWRNTRDPWAIWVSEIMLQQTQVLTVQGYYDRFLKRFPTVTSCAQADLQEVLNLWAGLGYYRRAKHLHAAAQQVLSLHNGTIPHTVSELLTLSGIGRYTAGAIASFAFGQSAPILDGNVMRVLARLTALSADISQPQTQKLLWFMAESSLPAPTLPTPKSSHPAGDYNQALMELGATICLPPPQTPQCHLCPLQKICQANASGLQNQLPIKAAKKATPTVKRIAIIVHNSQGQILLLQRPAGGLWEHLWEFPVFAEKPTPSRPISLNSHPPFADLVYSTLGLRVELEQNCYQVRHQLTHRLMFYRIYVAKSQLPAPSIHLPLCPDGSRHPHPYEQARWVPLKSLQGHFADADDRLPLATVVHKIAAAAGLTP